MTNPQKDIKDLYHFLDEQPLSVVAVQGIEALHPHLSIVYTFLGENKKLYFFTKNETHKYTMLKESVERYESRTN